MSEVGLTSLDSIPGVTVTTRKFVQMVRLYLRDFSELNRLIKGEETNDRMILWAVKDAVSDFNGTPQFTNFTLDSLLDMNLQHLMLRLTVISIIESVGLLQTRNHINYSTGGINVGVNDKTGMLMNWLQYFKSTTEQKKQQVKVAINVESILGAGERGVHSEYWAVNSTYLSY
jgi:hypothetical protein